MRESSTPKISASMSLNLDLSILSLIPAKFEKCLLRVSTSALLTMQGGISM